MVQPKKILVLLVKNLGMFLILEMLNSVEQFGRVEDDHVCDLAYLEVDIKADLEGC